MSGEACVRCPHCNGRDNLALIEVHEEVGETDPGRIFIDGDALIQPGDFWFSAGEPVRVVIACHDCGHEWRPRRQSLATPADPTRRTP